MMGRFDLRRSGAKQIRLSVRNPLKMRRGVVFEKRKKLFSGGGVLCPLR